MTTRLMSPQQTTVGQQFIGTDRAPLGNVLSVQPAKLTFGMVSSGFYYNLKFTVQNNSLTPMRIRATIQHREGDDDPMHSNSLRIVNLPDRIAPGMLVSIIVELTAETAGVCFFDLTIVQNLDASVFSEPIEAHIVTPDTFKYVRKSLELQKRPIYRSNVSMVTSIAGMDVTSHSTSATSFSEALIMDDEDVNDLFLFPMASNVYWDPFDKMLRIDPRLGGVIVDPQFEEGVEQSIRMTNRMRDDRLLELEEQGFLTQAAMARLKEEQTIIPLNVQSFSLDGVETVHSSSSDGDEDNSAIERAQTAGSMGSVLGEQSMLSRSSSRVSSVASLLALKRGKLESMRRATVNAATAFAKSSKSDSMVNSMRTLSMIQSRIVGVKYDGEQIL